MAIIQFTVNNAHVQVDITPDIMLSEVLRDMLHLTGVKIGCGVGECGACTVIMDGNPVASCITPAMKADGAEIITIEGVSPEPPAELDIIQKAFLVSGAVQCGFCTPGMVLAAKALLSKNPDPDEATIRKEFNGHLCRCTGYDTIIKAVQMAAKAIRSNSDIMLPDVESHAVVGQSIIRRDGIDKVKGAFQYGADFYPEDALFAVPVFSQHPYAIVRSVDTSKAENVPGFITTINATDIPGKNLQGVIIPDQLVIVPVGEKVLCISDVITIVVCTNEKSARTAAKLVEIEYEGLNGVFSPEEALKPDAPILHDPRPGDSPSNIMYGTHVEHGDVNNAFAHSDLILKREYHTPFAEHAYLEPEAGYAEWDDEKGVTIHMASQAITFHVHNIASIMGLPAEKIRLIHISPGGAFGARSDMSLQPYLALATYKTKKPVRMVLTRQESLRMHTKRHPMHHKVSMGCNRDGKFTALECEILADTGAYSSEGIPVLDQATLFATGPYEIPNILINGLSVYTNNIPCGAMRGFGIPQSAFAVECLIDELADQLNISPFEIRRINGLKIGSKTATGQVLQSSVPFIQTVTAAESAFEKAEQKLPAPLPGRKRGIGVASSYKNVGIGLGMPEPTGVIIDLLPSGKIFIRFGGAELGQGSDTTIAQIAADTLHAPYKMIEVYSCDTGNTPDGGVTSASRTTFMSGNAVAEAATIFFDLLQQEMGCTENLSENVLCSLAKKLQAEGRKISLSHTYQPPKTFPLSAQGESSNINFVTFSYATQVAIVDVDPTSGEVEVQKMIAVHDVGRTINPMGAKGQIEGSCVMGMGYALSEELILDKGYLATDTLAKVGIPTINHVPSFEVILIEDPEPSGPFGAKGIAEAAVIPSAPAIINAIHNAVNTRIYRLPATPDRVAGAIVHQEYCPQQ
jgi:selenium-dependent xanthine dehydrogenase